MNNTINDVNNDVKRESLDEENKSLDFLATLDDGEPEKCYNENDSQKGAGKDKFPSSHVVAEFKKAMFGLNPTEVYEYIGIITSNLENAQKVFEKKSEEYKNDSSALIAQRNSLRDKCSFLTEKLDGVEKKLEKLYTLENEKKSVEDENAQLKTMISEFGSKIEMCRNLIAENKELKIQIGDLKLAQEGTSEQEKRYQAEIEQLREVSKNQLYAFAQQKNDIETKFSNERLRLLKLLQVHTYHVRQSEELLAELQKQFEQSIDSLKELNID